MIAPLLPHQVDEVLDLWEGLMAAGLEADPRYRMAPDARRVMRPYAVDHWTRTVPFPHCLVAWEAGRAAGFATGHPDLRLPILVARPTMRIGCLFVAPDLRRRGVGRALVEALVDGACNGGFPAVEVGTLVRDERAVAFWRSLGFEDLHLVLARSATESAA